MDAIERRKWMAIHNTLNITRIRRSYYGEMTIEYSKMIRRRQTLNIQYSIENIKSFESDANQN